MNLSSIVFGLVLVALLQVVKSESFDFEGDDMWESLKGVENEADYDNFVKDLGTRSSGVNERSASDYENRAGKHPKFRPRFERQFREIFPDRDFEGNCPPGYRSDRTGLCREIW
ncbi:unnamed protein product [Hermetia illucens]|uniref:Uncharacterized protein n=1 Tax=Hermetia illucens TaxID=343691 RepID=A0A7R8YRP7_HERIL|nr:uncharacterized protein LOC119660388 [Hermetia illucens]CAD7079709.1 unnamed protein product [Hermetia illucens]